MLEGYVVKTITGIVCSCPECKGYSAYLPYQDSELVEHYMQKDCPKCGTKLAAYPTEKGY